ncbi:MAG: HAD family hydrolase [Thermoanaerobaculia bacterium]
MLKAIVFDLWETLISDPPEISKKQEQRRLKRIEEILSAAGHADTAERIENAYRRTWHRCLELYWSKDLDIPTRTQIDHFLESLELDPDSFSEEILGEIEHAYSIAALELMPILTPGAAELLERLKREYAIGLISNTGRTPGWVLREILDSHGLARWFDAMVFSNEHGECKPKRSIFEACCKALGVEPAEAVFVGDNLQVDVWGAQRCGMRGIHYIPPVRGLAVAPPSTTEVEVVPDAVIHDLAEIDQVLARLAS